MAGKTCSHGHVGYCHDDATPKERETFEFLHRHAYQWAIYFGQQDRDTAESYASHLAGAFWDQPGHLWPSHPEEFKRWMTEVV